MRQSILNIVQAFATISSITGLTFWTFFQNNAWYLYSLATVLAVLITVSTISLLQRSVISNKKRIDQIWVKMLANASDKVQIFAGDLSWFDTHREIVARKIENGIKVEIVLPISKIIEKNSEHIRSLLMMHALIKCLDENCPVRGLLIDPDSSHASALLVSKSLRVSILRRQKNPQESPIYKHTAIRYASNDIINGTEPIATLFKSLWQHGKELHHLAPLHAEKAEVAAYLSAAVPHYKKMHLIDISFKRVQTIDLYATCKYVKAYKQIFIDSLINSFEIFKIKLFEACILVNSTKGTYLLPPIIEEHNGKYVVIDGMHRLHFLQNQGDSSEVECIVIKTNTALPGKLVPFRSLKAISKKIPKRDSFENYRAKNFREIALLDDLLVQEFKAMQA